MNDPDGISAASAAVYARRRAIEKIRKAEDAWNTCDPAKVALAYTTDSHWRNRSEFLKGRPAIVEFLTRKWQKESEYTTHQGALGLYRRSHRGALRLRMARQRGCVVPGLWQRKLAVQRERPDATAARQHQRRADPGRGAKFLWDRPAPRPADHPGLSDLGL